MIFTKTAIKAFTFLALVGSVHSAKTRTSRGAQQSYLISFYNTTASSNDVNNVVLSQSNTVSNMHTVNANIATFKANSKADAEELRDAMPDGTLVELNTNVNALGWKVKDQDSGSFRGRKLAEETPYGLTMVQVTDALFDEVLPPPNGNIKVCVVDTGYALGHEDLPNKENMPVLGGYDQYGGKWDSDGHGHGSHCAGTIGAIGDNNLGVTSCNPDPEKFSFYIGKGLSDSGSGSNSGVLDAVEACVANGAKIVSMSLGGGGWSSAALNAYKDHYNDGVLIIAAAGNSGDSSLSYPASYPYIMSVAAVDSNKNKAVFSQYNDQVEIAAPGVNVMSTLPDDTYAAWSGTSMACPHVAGVAALVWSYFPDCENSQIRNVLLKSADRSMNEDDVCDIEYGHGIVNAKAAYELLSAEGCDAGGTAHGGSQAAYSFGGCEQVLPGDSHPPTPSPTPCQGLPLTVNLQTDNYGSETSWEVKHVGGGKQLQGSGYESNKVYNEELCLQPNSSGQCEFTIKDAYGDGMCCSYGTGSYEVKLYNTQVVEGGDFGSSESKTFDCGLSNTEAPVASPVSSPNAPVVPTSFPESSFPTPKTSFPSSLVPTASTFFPTSSTMIPSETSSSESPSNKPTPADTFFPSRSTLVPTESTSFPSSEVPTSSTLFPTVFSTSESPSNEPTSPDTSFPSSFIPTVMTSLPTATVSPSTEPTLEPTDEPTNEPSSSPSTEPTLEPTDEPTRTPSSEPTNAPTPIPTDEPTASVSATALYIAFLKIQTKEVNQGKKLKVTVSFTIKDEDNKKVAGAKVNLDYKQEGFNTKPMSKPTASSGKAKINFKVSTNRGPVTLSSPGIDPPDGYVYDKDLNHKYSDGCPAFSDNCASYVMG